MPFYLEDFLKQTSHRIDRSPSRPPSTAEEISGKDEERESFSEERVPLQVKDEDRPLPGDAKALEPSPDAQIPATSVKVEDDISAPKKESEMPSFDEWKMQQEEGKNKDHKGFII